MKRTAKQVVDEFLSTESKDYDQLVSAINYWAVTDMCPELNAGSVSERHEITKEDLPRWEQLARNIASELAIGDDAQVLIVIETGLAQAYWAEREPSAGTLSSQGGGN
jgi:hypothetical protein